MTPQPPLGIKAWRSISGGTITTVEPSSSTINRFTEGRFLTKDELIQISFQVAAEIYNKQIQTPDEVKFTNQLFDDQGRPINPTFKTDPFAKS